MDSFEALIGKDINEVTLNESTTFFIAPLKYSTKLCGKRYPSTKLKIADLDYFNLISFSELFKKEAILIIWYNEDNIITDLEIYYISNDFDILFMDYYKIKKAIDEGFMQNVTNPNCNERGYMELFGPMIPFNDTLVEIQKA